MAAKRLIAQPNPALVRVAVAVPLAGLFDYRLPPALSAQPGCRVRVPFGRRREIGIVVDLPAASECPPGRLREVEAVLDETPLLGADDIAFLRWVAAYYHHPPGEVLASALPLRLRHNEDAMLPDESGWQLTAEGVRHAASPPARAPRQAELLRWLSTHPRGRAPASLLRAALPGSAAVLRALLERSWVERVTLPVEPDPVIPGPAPELHPEQAAALSALPGPDRFAVALLDGVTGSGKTEVYLRAAADTLARGRSVLILVPEISLTPQLYQRCRERLGDTVRVLHSSMADGEREQVWHRIRLGLSRVLLGTRSAVFTPMPELGLIVVDEEHDASFKQTEGFRYSARDMAVTRGQRVACTVLLGSATPSLESLRHAREGRYLHLRLRQRAAGAQRPRMRLLDIRDQPLHCGISDPLLARVSEVLARGEQAMLFLNRRGYAPVLGCFSCGWLSDCPRCDARQTLHRASGLLWCHHCGAQRRVPTRCPECGAEDLHPIGRGTEQLDEFLAARFADVPLIRVDRDATARKGSLEAKLERLHAADAALLIGTQMLAKGHHFPRVTLVGVLDADGGLFSADFRATERMAQLLTQVAGRAGRGERPGEVLIQTRHPDHPLLQTLVHDGYGAFARQALDERAAAAMPPFTYQALLRAEAGKQADAATFVDGVVEAARALRVAGVDLWGPVPAPMTRRAGRHRVHLLLQAAQREPLHRLLRGLMPAAAALPQARRVRWSMDVDPIDLY
ncbi:MAG: primosomal protein N' [Gammaproteobacteria bacterium]|nr:primosomal protein N' [Gammaproteobacteria bacterium]